MRSIDGQGEFIPCDVSQKQELDQLRDQIFWYKADSHPPFKLGSKEFWEYSKELDSDDDAPYDPNNSRKRNAGPTISVKKANKR